MKELSIEEKAKAYDKAIERAKQHCADYVVETIFPELKESEDERIRNFISNELACLRATDGKGTVRYNELTEAITWLEKQGEHKQTDWLKSLKDRVQPKQEWSEEDKYNHNIILSLLNNECVGSADKRIAIGWLKSLKDRVQPQPKQWWSEEDDIHFDTILKELQEQKQRPINYPYLKDIDSDVDWLKSIKDRVLPKQEWSKEDEKMINFIVKLLPAQPLACKWLKSLKDRVQPKQEWSEEDKRKIDRIYYILLQAADTHAFSTTCRLIGDKECVELQDFLKSLKPQKKWKPSDEQMKRLKGTINSLPHQEVLYSLYKDLKKLKE